MLYKYTHQKLDYFCKVPELAFLYKYYYEFGIQQDKEEAAALEALEYIDSDCSKTLVMLKRNE